MKVDTALLRARYRAGSEARTLKGTLARAAPPVPLQFRIPAGLGDDSSSVLRASCFSPRFFFCKLLHTQKHLKNNRILTFFFFKTESNGCFSFFPLVLPCPLPTPISVPQGDSSGFSSHKIQVKYFWQDCAKQRSKSF